jgi:predicted phosphodiesterase
MVRGVLWRRVWDALTPPKRAWRILKAWWQQAGAGVEFLDQYFPNSDILLIGHFHRAGWWRCRGKIVVNTGSFMSPGSAYWAEWSQGVLTWGQIEERPDACQLGRARKRWQP